MNSLALQDILPNSSKDFVCMLIVSLDFLHDYEALFVSNFKRKSSFTTWSKGRVALFKSEFDILWIVIIPVYDDDIFDAPCNKYLPLAEKSQVASTQERTFSCVCRKCVKRFARLLGLLPITLCYAWTRDPDFSHFISTAAGQFFRVNNYYTLVCCREATSNEGLRHIFFCCYPLFDLMLFYLSFVEISHYRLNACRIPRYHQLSFAK